MSEKAKVFLAFTGLSFIVAGLRFVPAAGIPRGATDFASGLGVGLLMGVLVTWGGERGA